MNYSLNIHIINIVVERIIMKKLLYVIYSLEDCGPVKVLYNIICGIDRTKYEVFVLALFAAPQRDLQSSFESLGVKVYVLTFSWIRMLISGNYLLSKFIKKIKPDIVHTQCFFSTFFMQSFGQQIKLCTTIHCLFYEDFAFTYGKSIGSAMTWMYVNALKKYNVCVACSENVERELLKKYQINLTHVRNGTQIPILQHTKEKYVLNKKRNNIGVSEKQKMFICTGVICARKNQVQILRCLKKLNNVSVVFLGDGPDFEVMRNEAPGNAIFLGNVNDVYEYLSIADGFVSTSFSEGMPNAVLEALMMGLPCILSNIEPHCEIKRAYSEACYLYEIDDDDDLLACFRKVIDMEMTWEVHENISNVSRKLFSSEAMSRKYQDIYEAFGFRGSFR